MAEIPAKEEKKEFKKKDVQRNAYQLTINNPAGHGIDHMSIKRELIEGFTTLDYFAMSDEVSESGTPHTHVYMHCTSRVRFSKVKKHFPAAHIEAALADAQTNVDYIRKRGERYADKKETSVPGTFEEYGTMPKQEGKRPEMAKLIGYIKSGDSNAEILEKNNDYALNIHLLDKIRTTFIIDEYRNKRRLDLRVTYVSGATGAGKTRDILDAHGDGNVCRVSDYRHPFDGYQTQDVLCFDEFRSSLPIGDMLNYLDVYPIELPARYSNRFSCYNYCYVVSNWRLEEQYPEVQRSSPESWKAFLRRIHEVVIYEADGSRTVYPSVQEYLEHVQREKDARDNPFTQGKIEF